MILYLILFLRNLIDEKEDSTTITILAQNYLMSIQVQQVSKVYGAQKALDQISFEINKGEIVGFLGPNGAGKSTMMKIICGYLPPSTGQVSVCDLPVYEHELLVKQKIGYLPEHNPLYLDQYVKEFLDFIADIHQIPNKKERIAEVIGLTGLSLEQNKKISALSKGYRQRVGIAQAIIHDPEVLILDEPTTGLDPHQIVEIRQLIQKIGAEKTVMLSTHIMQEVEAICSRAIIFNRGQVVADQSVQDLKNNNQKFIFEIEFEKPCSKEFFLSIKGILFIDQLAADKYCIHCENENVRKAIVEESLKSNNLLTQITRKGESLEHIFQQLTK